MAEATSMTELNSSRTSDRSLLRGGISTQESPFSFDGGDVTISVTFNGEAMKGKVVSGSMASASSVWKKFLYPPWSTKGDGPVKELDFSEDDGEALLVLLHIVHFQFAKVPTSFKGWCSRLSDTSLPLYAGDTRRKAYIAWAFGSVDIFLEFAKTLVLKCRIQENGTLEDDECILPDKLLESIQKVREATLKKLLAIPYAQADDCEAHPASTCGNKECKPQIHASLLSQLGKRKLWPRKTSGELLDSVATIAGLIEDLNIEYPRDRGLSGIYPWNVDIHLKCTVDYRKEVARVLHHIPNPTLECHIRHMQLRNGSVTAQELVASARSGLADDLMFLHSTPVRKESNGFLSSSLGPRNRRVPTKKKASPPEKSTLNHCPRCSSTHSQLNDCPINHKKRPAPWVARRANPSSLRTPFLEYG